jgi:tetratricopeptide (TPR) repeat protein
LLKKFKALHFQTRKKQVVISFSYLLFFIFVLSSCASNSPPLSSYTQIETQKILDVPFFPQKEFYCGPSALASIFIYHGKNTSPDDLASQIFIPEKKGSLQLEMKAATRRADFLPYQLTGNINELFTEVQAGNPVLVLQNLSLSWAPQWHYATVVGYNLNTETVILHSGSHREYNLSIKTFLNTWKRANYWALVPVPPDTLPATVKLKAFNQASTSLESTGHRNAAFKAYQTSLEKWPNNEISLMGIGTYYFSNGEYQKSSETFLSIIQFQHDNHAAWNNLAYTLYKQQCFDLSNVAIERALELAPNHTAYIETKKELSETPFDDYKTCQSSLSSNQLKELI